LSLLSFLHFIVEVFELLITCLIIATLSDSCYQETQLLPCCLNWKKSRDKFKVCEFTVRNCPDENGIAIYGENSTLIKNRITNNAIGTSLFGNESEIVGNSICSNFQGVWMANNVEYSKLYYDNLARALTSTMT